MSKKSLFVNGANSANLVPTPVASSLLGTDGYGNWSFIANSQMKYTVSPPGSSANAYTQYTSIQAAIDQAIADGTSYDNPAVIVLWPGYFVENVTATVSGLSIVTEPRVKDQLFWDGALNLTLTGANAIFSMYGVTFTGVSGGFYPTLTASGSFVYLDSVVATVPNLTISSGSYWYLQNSYINSQITGDFLTVAGGLEAVNSGIQKFATGSAIKVTGVGYTDLKYTIIRGN